MSRKFLQNALSIVAVALTSCNFPTEANVKAEGPCAGGIPTGARGSNDYFAWTDGSSWHLDDPSPPQELYISLLGLIVSTYHYPASEVWDDSNLPIGVWLSPDRYEDGRIHIFANTNTREFHTPVTTQVKVKNEICFEVGPDGMKQVYRRQLK